MALACIGYACTSHFPWGVAGALVQWLSSKRQRCALLAHSFRRHGPCLWFDFHSSFLIDMLCAAVTATCKFHDNLLFLPPRLRGLLLNQLLGYQAHSDHMDH